MSDFDRDELICEIWGRHSDSDGLMDIMGAQKFAIDLLSEAPAQPSPAESDKEAVRNAALEEAALACEEESLGDHTEHPCDIAYNNAIIHAADAIRALKTTSVSEVSHPAQPSEGEDK